jgi:hypothetical protein
MGGNGKGGFTYAEREKYAGHAASVHAALRRLTEPGNEQVLLVVTGASGSGKSSFAQAGLWPALEAHYHERHLRLRAAVFRPSRFPLDGLADALRQLGIRGVTLHLDTRALPRWCPARLWRALDGGLFRLHQGGYQRQCTIGSSALCVAHR